MTLAEPHLGEGYSIRAVWKIWDCGITTEAQRHKEVHREVHRERSNAGVGYQECDKSG
jgi:hypothetical protein